MIELAKSPARSAGAGHAVFAHRIGRPYFLPPDVPAERVEALRRAFDATMKDEGFFAEATRIGLDVDPLTGEQVQKLVADLANTPADVVARVRAALNEQLGIVMLASGSGANGRPDDKLRRIQSAALRLIRIVRLRDHDNDSGLCR